MNCVSQLSQFKSQISKKYTFPTSLSNYFDIFEHALLIQQEIKTDLNYYFLMHVASIIAHDWVHQCIFYQKYNKLTSMTIF